MSTQTAAGTRMAGARSNGLVSPFLIPSSIRRSNVRHFPIGVGVHQGSALSQLLFMLVMEEATKHCRRGDPWELLNADDLVLSADTKQGVEEMFNE